MKRYLIIFLSMLIFACENPQIKTDAKEMADLQCKYDKYKQRINELRQIINNNNNRAHMRDHANDDFEILNEDIKPIFEKLTSKMKEFEAKYSNENEHIKYTVYFTEFKKLCE